MKLKVVETWSVLSVHRMCEESNFYTRGTVEEYHKMLDVVRDNLPSPTILYAVAKDIYEHSRPNSIENIMFLLSNFVVKRFYELEDEPQDIVTPVLEIHMEF